jgi:hypothetical protein
MPGGLGWSSAPPGDPSNRGSFVIAFGAPGIQRRAGLPAVRPAPDPAEWSILPGRVNSRIAADSITHIAMECFVYNWRNLLGGAASAAILTVDVAVPAFA